MSKPQWGVLGAVAVVVAILAAVFLWPGGSNPPASPVAASSTTSPTPETVVLPVGSADASSSPTSKPQIAQVSPSVVTASSSSAAPASKSPAAASPSTVAMSVQFYCAVTPCYSNDQNAIGVIGVQSASGFTPNGAYVTYAIGPDGQAYTNWASSCANATADDDVVQQVYGVTDTNGCSGLADASGQLTSWQWPIPNHTIYGHQPGDLPGDYKLVIVDLTSGRYAAATMTIASAAS